MTTTGRLFVATALIVGFVGTGWSYTRPRFFNEAGAIKQSRWPIPGTIPVLVNTNDNAGNIVPGSQPFLAVRNMFELRSAYSPLRFALAPTDEHDTLGWDGTNLVTFVQNEANDEVLQNFAAVGFFWFVEIEGELVLVESDVAFSANYDFTTTGSGGIDIEGLGGHELAHLQSLDHTAVMASLAYPTYFTEVPNERNLTLDDRASMELLHPFPDTASRTGSLSGFVEKPGGVPVFGAHVVAQRRSDGEPVSDISIFGGEWRIDALPPGSYRVYVEPLDGPYAQPWLLCCGVYQFPIDSDFLTTFYGGNATPTAFSVTAGTETNAGTIVIPAAGGPLNLIGLGLTSVPNQWWISQTALNVEQGDSWYLTLHGSGIHQVPDNGVSFSGTGLHAFSSGVQRGFFQGNPWMKVLFTVDPDALPGARTIWVNDGTRLASLTGGIEIHPSTPYPNLLRNDELESVAPFDLPLSGLFPLDSTGPDGFPGNGEGVLREWNGSDDDDDLYVPHILSGFLDPDVDVLTDISRPLVFYRLDDPSLTLFLKITEFGRLEVTYADSP